MIGVYKIDAETWNQDFPVNVSVKYYEDTKRMSVMLVDGIHTDKAPLRTNYYGPVIGFGSRKQAQEVRDWLLGGNRPYNENALEDMGVLLACLWAKRFTRGLPDIERAEKERPA